jgi:proteasome accessory factor B
VHLHFAPKVAGNVAEVLWHRSQRIEHRPDGSIDFHARVDGIGEISWWILGYGDQVEVLDPPELRTRIAETVSRMAAIYQGPKSGIDPVV